MGSIKARLAGEKIVESLGNKKPVTLGQVLREVGYADNTADTPKNVTETKSYKEVTEPFIQKLEKERDRIVLEMSVRDLDEVQYQHLTSAVDTLTKNIQLLGGRETEKMGVTIEVVSYEGNNPTQISTS